MVLATGWRGMLAAGLFAGTLVAGGAALAGEVCQDLDADGFQDAVCGGNDCDDTDPSVNPSAAEISCDGIDNDCNAVIDETNQDADGDGVDECSDCDDGDSSRYPGNVESCDGVDNDCDGLDDSVDSDFPDQDADGHNQCYDCNDVNSSIHPGAQEISCDGVDNDCNAVIDETNQDADGDGVDECSDCDDGDPTVSPNAPDLPCDNLDNDCDSLVDETRQDADADSVDECSDCDDGDPNVFPGANEVCSDGQDNDCNARSDCSDAACDPECADGDLFASHDDPSSATGQGPVFRAPADGSSLSPNWTVEHSPLTYDVDVALDPLSQELFVAGLADRGLWTVDPTVGGSTVWTVTPAPGEPGGSCAGVSGSAVYYERLGFDRDGRLYATGGNAQGDPRALYRLDLDRNAQSANEVCVGTLDDSAAPGPSGAGLVTGGTDFHGFSRMDLAFDASNRMWLTAGDQLHRVVLPSLAVAFVTRMQDVDANPIVGDGVGFTRTGDLRVLEGDGSSPGQHWSLDPNTGAGTPVGAVGDPGDCTSFGPCIPSGLSDELPVFVPEPAVGAGLALGALALVGLGGWRRRRGAR